jgi:hypothetical protein
VAKKRKKPWKQLSKELRVKHRLRHPPKVVDLLMVAEEWRRSDDPYMAIIGMYAYERIPELLSEEEPDDVPDALNTTEELHRLAEHYLEDALSSIAYDMNDVLSGEDW